MKITTVFLTFFFCWFSYGQYKFVLKGKVKDSTKKIIYLQIRDDYSLNEFVKTDSCLTVNGVFSFSGEIKKKAEIANLFFTDESSISSDPDKFRFVLAQGINTMNIDNPKSNSKSLFSNTQRPLTVSNELYNRLENLYNTYFLKYASDVKSWDPKKPEEIQYIKLLDSPEINARLRKEQLEIVKKYPSAFYSLIFLYKSLHHSPYLKNPEVLTEIFHTLDESIKKDPLGAEFIAECRRIMKAEQQAGILQPVPSFEIKTDKGELFKNSSLAGKPYIIAFSATWCAPCKEMEPRLKSLYDTYKNYGLEVVYFNFDDNDKKWKDHISKKQFEWINVSDGLKAGESPIIKQFNVTGIPQYIIVDRKGMIIYNSSSPTDKGFTMLEKYIISAVH